MNKFACAFVLTALPLLSAGLSDDDRQFAVQQLETSRKQFIDSIANVSEAQWKFKSAPDRWSVAECAEHITLTEEMFTNMVMGVLKGEPKNENRATREIDQKLLAGMTDRSQKFKAPEPVQPKSKFATKAEVIAAFNKLRDRNVEYVKTTQLDLRGFAFDFGPMKADALQGFLVMAGHAMRHTAQIKEVQADAKYPK